MKKVLIYGDSNVWGDNFLTGTRIPDCYQWPKILKKKLEPNFEILEAGLPGRIAGNEEVEKAFKNGKDSFLAVFRSSAPLDHIILMLGTNDLQLKYQKSAQTIIEDLLWYQQIIMEEYKEEDNKKKYFVNGKMPKFTYILPINFDYLNHAKEVLDLESEEKRQAILTYFKNHYHSQSLICPSMPLFDDGIHLNYEGHKKLAELVEDVLNEYK